MVKIVIFVAIAALACVNAQYFPVLPTNEASNMLKNMARTNPAAALISQMNMKVISPEELFKRQSGPGQNGQAQYVSSFSSGDGKQRTSVLRKINGETTGFTVNN